MKKLHLGCGSVLIDGWVNIDLDSPVADLHHDLTEPLPFADASISHIFAEHLIEHVDHSEAHSLVNECWRVLKPGGVLRLTTPDLNWLATVYFSSLTHLWGELWQPGSPCAMLNEGMRAWGHKYLYDSPELHALLVSRGFSQVTEYAWRESDDPVLAGLESRPYNHELIVEARKGPGGVQGGVRHARQTSMPRPGVMDDLLVEQGRKLQEFAGSMVALQAEAERLSGFVAEFESARQSVHELRARESLVIEEANKLREVIVDREALIADLQRQVLSWQDSIASADRRASENADYARGLQEEVSRRGERIVFLEGMVNDLTVHIGGLDAEIASRGDAIAALTAETERLLVVSADLQAGIVKLDSRCAEQVATIAALTEEVRSNTRTVEEQERTLSRLRETYLGRWLLRRTS